MECSMPGQLGGNSCLPGTICDLCIQLTVAAITFLVGLLIAWKPKDVINTQTAIYRRFNWRLEPISMEKEVRNMRIAGCTLIFLGTVAFAVALVVR